MKVGRKNMVDIEANKKNASLADMAVGFRKRENVKRASKRDRLRKEERKKKIGW